MHRICTPVAILLFSLLATSTASATPPFLRFSQLYVFGDSLSDTGNTEIVAPGGDIPDTDFTYGSNGRFTNERVWAEMLGARLGLGAWLTPSRAGGTNFAHGGAEINVVEGPSTGLLTQYGMWQAAVGEGGADPYALYVVWAGSNDLRAAMLDPNTDFPAFMEARMGAYFTVLQGLIANGARTLLVPNLLNLGYAPESRLAGVSAEVTALVQHWNAAQQQMLAALSAQSGATIITVDMFALSDGIMANPRRYGFRNVTDACSYVVNNVEISCPHPDAYVFWDVLHPTSAVHQLIADAAHRALLRELAGVPDWLTPLLSQLFSWLFDLDMAWRAQQA